MTTQYRLHDASELPSPALLIDLDRFDRNADRVIAIAGSPDRVWPHMKTQKSADLARRLMRRGFHRFKCTTIAEAEMLAGVEAPEVLVAYQLLGPHPGRLAELARRHPGTRFSTLVDDPGPLHAVSAAASRAGVTIGVMLDVDLGMHRTGIAPGGEGAIALYRLIAELPGVEPAGLHGYDGHNHQRSRDERIAACDRGTAEIKALRAAIEAAGLPVPRRVMGGTPTFPCHARHADAELSPGTCFLHDLGYADMLPDLTFEFAGLLFTRVLSASTPGYVTFDLGNKAIAADPPGERGRFLGIDGTRTLIHNEEHWLLAVSPDLRFRVGEEHYVIPRHVCPCVALHRQFYAVQDGRVQATYEVTARDRALTV